MALTDTVYQKLRTGFTGLAALRGIALILSSVGSIVVARSIGPAAFGQLAFILAVASVLAIPSNNTAVPFLVRFTAAYNHPASLELLRGAASWSARQALVWGASGTIALLCISTWVWLSDSRVSAIPYFVASLLIPFWAVAARVSGMLQGLKRVVLAQLFDWAVQPSIYLGLLLLLFLFQVLSIEYVLACLVAALCVSSIAGWITLRRTHQFNTARSFADKETWQRSWRQYLLIQVVSVANLKLPILVIGGLSISSEAGQYRAAESIATLVAIIISIANSTLGPYVSQLFHTNELGKLQEIMQRTSRLIFTVALPLCIALILWGEWLLSFIYGAEFRGAYLALVILAVGQLINVACGSVGLLLNMTGHEGHAFRSLSCAFGFAVVLCILLVPDYGAVGAAIASTSSMVIWNVLQLITSIRDVRVKPSII